MKKQRSRGAEEQRSRGAEEKNHATCGWGFNQGSEGARELSLHLRARL
ncbi:MAG: hypothetical protein V7L23_14970 [Nostoc sp.]